MLGKNKDSRTSLRSITGLSEAIEKPNLKSVQCSVFPRENSTGMHHKGHRVSVMVQWPSLFGLDKPNLAALGVSSVAIELQLHLLDAYAIDPRFAASV